MHARTGLFGGRSDFKPSGHGSFLRTVIFPWLHRRSITAQRGPFTSRGCASFRTAASWRLDFELTFSLLLHHLGTQDTGTAQLKRVVSVSPSFPPDFGWMLHRPYSFPSRPLTTTTTINEEGLTTANKRRVAMSSISPVTEGFWR